MEGSSVSTNPGDPSAIATPNAEASSLLGGPPQRVPLLGVKDWEVTVPAATPGQGNSQSHQRSPPVVLLAGLSFDLAAGECLHLTGRSGLGKSTLLRSLAALVDAGAGRVELNGQGPAAFGYPEWRRRVCYVAPRVETARQSLEDWLEHPRSYGAVALARRGGAVPWGAWLERVGLPRSFLGRSLVELSTGERQRVAVLRALGVEPRVLLLDEAATGLDGESLRGLSELLADWRRGQGGGILWVSHQPIVADRTLDLSPFAPGRPAEQAPA